MRDAPHHRVVAAAHPPDEEATEAMRAGSLGTSTDSSMRSEWGWLALVAVVFAPAVLAMAEVWTSVSHYSHGFLVPLVSAAAFPGSTALGPVRRDPRGLAVLVASLPVYAVGLGTASPTLQGLALVIAVAGLALRLWGPDGLRRLAFPVGFLVFMVPLPPALVTPVVVELQMGVSAAAVALARELGLAVLREGNVLVLPGGERLFVAEACSGITSIVTLTPLGVAYAHFAHRTWLRRLLVVAAVVPLAMLGNVVRVVATVVAAERWGTRVVVDSALHGWAGLLTFALVCAALVGFGSCLGPSRRNVPA